MANSPEEIKKAKIKYLVIFALLLCCTVATVLVATVETFDIGGRGFDAADMILGLAIASFKAGLVLWVFMHFNDEKKAVYWLFASGIVFCIALMALTGWAYSDPIHFDGFYDGTSEYYDSPASSE